METIDERVSLKNNVIRLAKHHKEHCNGQGCDISLYLLERLLILAGIELSDKERMILR